MVQLNIRPTIPERLLMTPLLCLLLSWPAGAMAQEELEGLDTGGAAQNCFGMSGIDEPRALAICEALALDRNVQARELAEEWVSGEPESPGAHFSLAEVLSEVEGNLPRALYHLNRTEELTDYSSLGRAMASDNMEWHYLALTELSYTHQLIGNQQESLRYLEKTEEVYGQDTESFRGWPLLKLEKYEEARASAEKVLETNNDPLARSRAWNTLCAVELADLRPLDSLEACENAMQEDEASGADTVHLLNASEVSLSLLRFQEAEDYLDRATQPINPDSVGNPWVQLLYLYMNQGRFEEARSAMDSMLVWHDRQTPLVGVMNRGEHLMVQSMFLLLAGYPEDAARLTRAALNQPDRTGSYTASRAQKDAVAALVNAMAHRMHRQMLMEEIATQGFWESLSLRTRTLELRFNTWRSQRHAASLLAERQTLQNRLRPYAPLDVHVPEWVEPELVRVMGRGMMAGLLRETEEAGAFSLNRGYYHSWQAELAYHGGSHGQVLQQGEQALRQLPAEEALLRARLAARMAQSAMSREQYGEAMRHYQLALREDPSVLRRLGMALPVSFTTADTGAAGQLADSLRASPRFITHDRGLPLSIRSEPAGLQVCLGTPQGESLACTQQDPEAGDADDPLAELLRRFHRSLFTPGFTLSQSRRMALLGGSVVTQSRSEAEQQATDSVMQD